MPMMRILGMGVAAVLTAGCGSLNNELVVGDRRPELGEEGAYLLSTLNPPDGVQSIAPGAPVRDAAVPPPSILGVTRDNWAPTAFTVPVDGTEHYAMHRNDPDLTNQTPAQRNEEYPSEFTVIHGRPTLRSNLQQAAEAGLAPFYAGLDAVLLIPRLIVDPPWEVMTSPRDAYQRSPRPLPRLGPAAPPADTAEPANPLPDTAPTDPGAGPRANPEQAPRQGDEPPVQLPDQDTGRPPTREPGR